MKQLILDRGFIDGEQVGRCKQEHGIDILIKAFAEISHHWLTHRLYLCGFPHPDVIAQQHLIKNLNQESQIKHVSPVDRELIPAVLKNAELAVLPRPDSRQARGGFPTKLGEYLASGTPVCVTSVGETRSATNQILLPKPGAKLAAFLANRGAEAKVTVMKK
jgi:glycosyltransferase involved in cell wall biosynthesis